MKKATKHLLQSFMLFSTLLFFVLFSNGLSFSLHYCDNCHQTKLFMFQHPNCCAESAHIHQSEKECSDEQCDCHATHVKHHEAHCGTAHHCCNTTHKYIRIASPFVSANHADIMPVCVDLFDTCNLFNEVELTIPTDKTSNSDPPPMLTKAGDSSFLHFVSQNILYA